MAEFQELVDELERSYREAQERLSDPAVYNDHREAAEVGRRVKELEGPYKLAQQWREVSDDLEAARGDGDLRELIPELEERQDALEEELKLALVESDPADSKDVIVEIRQGVGGDEAALWAGDVYRMLHALRRAPRLHSRAALGERATRRRLQGGRVRGQGRRRATRSSSGKAARTASSACPRPSRRAGSTPRRRRSR